MLKGGENIKKNRMTKISAVLAIFTIFIVTTPIAISSELVQIGPTEKEIEPAINIEEISGGFDVHTLITNTGDQPATNITWLIEIDGNFVITRKGEIPPAPVIPELDAGESIVVTPWKDNFIFGLGDVEITVSVTYDQGFVTKTIDGVAFLFLLGINQ